MDTTMTPVTDATTDVATATTSTFDLDQAVQDTVADHVNRGTSFSKYSISQAIRNSNPTEDVPHDTVKSVVERLMNTVHAGWQKVFNGTFMTYHSPTANLGSTGGDDPTTTPVSSDADLAGVVTSRVSD